MSSSTPTVPGTGRTAARPTLRPPEDGILSSARPGGWLADQWTALLQAHAARSGDGGARLARGRSWARGGRVRDLAFSPGLVMAEVVDGETRQVSVRLPVLENAEWRLVVAALAERLDLIAALLEGELPKQLVAATDKRQVRLVPRAADLDSDCDCADYVVPCAHVAAVHTVVADALDGDPFLLLMLRGRSREQLLGQLRREWGEADGPTRTTTPVDEEPRPTDDWFSSPSPLPILHFDFGAGAQPAAGLLAAGTPVGGPDLVRALLPLYEAGAAASWQIAHIDTPTTAEAPIAAAAPVPETPEPAPPAPDEDLTERIVDFLTETDSARTDEIARAVGRKVAEIRDEMHELAQLGIVVRTGQARGTRWRLG